MTPTRWDSSEPSAAGLAPAALRSPGRPPGPPFNKKTQDTVSPWGVSRHASFFRAPGMARSAWRALVPRMVPQDDLGVKVPCTPGKGKCWPTASVSPARGIWRKSEAKRWSEEQEADTRRHDGVRWLKSSKPGTCTERHDVNPTGISGTNSSGTNLSVVSDGSSKS
ncbi:hypothetical protein SAMN05443545_101553 [Aidingimonas halophila]|uniref:Uncharacterized protein n=1 Tax=Aidingimonas halophila TaxID=574349 RepID=A0A1H2SGB2_9GAMM|nr:hypothetical protein SAMN05443545_101553 [Aidingimonas halophila]